MEIAEGYYILPRGKIANAVTWLEREVPAGAPRPQQDLCSLRRLRGQDIAAYRDIYARVGTDWLWTGHLEMSDATLAAQLEAEAVEAYAAMLSGRAIGLLEMKQTAENGIELVYFGLAPEATSQGLGGWLMQEAIAAASRRGAQRLWLHTCNYDHPSALRFYRRCGFKIFAQGFEVMADPRLQGIVPKETAPHVPMLD